MKKTIYYILILGIFWTLSAAQVCSPIGQLCTRTTDCCKGCCEAHTCVDRAFSCSTDMILQPGYASCNGFYCQPGSICFLREVCPPENACPPAPSCRKIDREPNNFTDWRYRNSCSKHSTNLTLLWLILARFAVFRTA